MVDNALKPLRKSKWLTQRQAAELLGVSLRCYQAYENEVAKWGTRKCQWMVCFLENYSPIEENKGILSLEQIRQIVSQVVCDKDIDFVYLFGSYAQGKANDLSDVDLLIDFPIIGLKFYGLIEGLRVSPHKVVDLLRIKDLLDNEPLLRNVLKDGIKVYQRVGFPPDSPINKK